MEGRLGECQAQTVSETGSYGDSVFEAAFLAPLGARGGPRARDVAEGVPRAGTTLLEAA